MRLRYFPGVTSCMLLLMLGAGLELGLSAVVYAQGGVQIPPAVKQQLGEIQDRFASVLDEECPAGSCYSTGCKASRFDTLDQTQDSSLPGLESDATPGKPQYRLASVLCEFAFEPTLSQVDLNNIRQRVREKVKTVGVDVQLATRQLQPRPVEPPSKSARDAANAPPVVPPTREAELWAKMLPFLPWFLGAVVLTLLTMLLIWGIRRLGRSERRSPGMRSRASDLNGDPQRTHEAEPTPRMILTRVDQMRGELKEDKRLVELSLKKYFDEEDYGELSNFLKHFGPELLTAFKEKAEYREALAKLSDKYAASEPEQDPVAMWRFLDKLDRDIVAAKVRIDAEPLADDFNFLGSMEIDEFVGVLRELSEEEAIAAVSYAPRTLRERFFAHANPTFTAKFVEHLTRVEKIPDAFVRQVAAKLRRIYAEKGTSLRQVRVDRIPLLEEALNALEPAKRRQLIASIGKDRPDFVQSMGPAFFLDDALPLLPTEILTEALLAITPEEAGHYLANFTWGPDVLAKVSPRLADSLRKHIPLAPVEDSRLARSAHEKLSLYIKKLHAQGVIDLRQINASLVG